MTEPSSFGQARLAPAKKVLVDADRGKAALVVVTAVALSLAGLWAYWPYLSSECRRLEPLKVGIIFLGDALALAWFLRFAASHALKREATFRPIRPTTRFGWAVLASAVAGLGLDLAMTLHQMHVAQGQYRDGESAVAEVLRVRQAAKPARTRYRFTVRFKDADDRPWRTELETWRSRKKGWLAGTDAKLIAQLRSGQVSELPIRYDRAWPQRAWIKGVGPHGDNIAWFSLVVMSFQAIFVLAGTVPFLVSLREHARLGRVPWWHDLHEVIPLAVEAGLMLFAGAVYRSWSWRPPAGSAWGS